MRTVDLAPANDSGSLPSAAFAGRFDILRAIGAGRSAQVFAARRSGSDEVVALKILRHEYIASIDDARFEREAHFLAALSHPRILPLLEWGRVGGVPFIVTPLANDDSLRARLDRESVLSLSETIEILAQVADALDYAHGLNVMHRDLKPENILLDGPRVLLGDFGIARAIVLSSADARISSSNTSVGTLSYMAPEAMLADAPVDARCDIYALGCVAFEMLAGEPPFVAGSDLALIARHASVPPRAIHSVRPELPAAVDVVLAQALAKHPTDRPGSACQIVDALRHIATS